VVPGYISVNDARASQADMLERAIGHIAAEVHGAEARLRGPGPIFLGIGASYAAAGSAVWTLRSRGIEALRLNAGEQPIPFPISRHPVIGVSQSGRSTETLAVLSALDPAQRMAVVNVAPSPIADMAAVAISLGNIADSYASTIGYTATIAALGMIAEAWDGGALDPAWSQLAVAFRALEASMKARGPALAAKIASATSVDYAAAAPSIGSAEVGALLLREIARIPASGYSTRQYLHGAMESAGQTAHVLAGGEREIGVAHTLARAGHECILITTLDVSEEARLAVIRLPDVSATQRTILEALVMQCLAVETAGQRGVDPDAFVFFHTDTKVA